MVEVLNNYTMPWFWKQSQDVKDTWSKDVDKPSVSLPIITEGKDTGRTHVISKRSSHYGHDLQVPVKRSLSSTDHAASQSLTTTAAAS